MMTLQQPRSRTDLRIWAICFVALAFMTCWFELFPHFKLWQAWLSIPLSVGEMLGGWTSGLPQLLLGLAVAFVHAVLSWITQYFILVFRYWKEDRKFVA